jgi:hypothetical protein
MKAVSLIELLKGKGVIAILLCLFSLAAAGQDVQVRGGFLVDSIKIGEPAPYYLTARYPSDQTVLFPDSTHAFTPFEYQSKEYFLTHTTGGISADSVVYLLTTFEVDRTQYLNLPVYVVIDRDSTVVTSETDSLLITQFVAQVPDTVATPELPLRMNTAYQKVFYDFNVWLVIIIVAVLIVVAVIVWLLFGKKIRRYFLMKRMQKNHASFLTAYNTWIAQLRTAFSSPVTESALFVWKRYMEQLDAKPYTKLTTHETQRLIPEPAVAENLRTIDRAIYGHETAVVESLENLKKFADQQFQRKMKEVQHG